jgi:hypothetical protein
MQNRACSGLVQRKILMPDRFWVVSLNLKGSGGGKKSSPVPLLWIPGHRRYELARSKAFVADMSKLDIFALY